MKMLLLIICFTAFISLIISMIAVKKEENSFHKKLEEQNKKIVFPFEFKKEDLYIKK